jgi:hypothetical protein
MSYNMNRSRTYVGFRLALMMALMWAASGCWIHAVRADFGQLSNYLPTGANAVVVVNAEKMFASPLAEQEGWQMKFADAFEATPFILPPTAKQCIIAARLNSQSLHPEWQAAAMELAVDPDMAGVAKRRGGELKQLSGAQVVELPGQIWAAKFGERLFGVLKPASEELAARWIALAKDGAPDKLTPYLRQSVQFADTAGTDIILAVDTEDLKEENVRSLVAASDILKGVPADQATKILASLEGVKFGVKVTDRMNGRLQFDFAEAPTALGPVVKPLILAIVGKAGAMLEEFPAWTGVVEGNSIALEGDLTDEGMRRIFSLLELNPVLVEPPTAYEPPTPAPTAQEAMAKSSQRYFKAVSKFVESAQRLNRADSLGQALMWLDNFARRVQSLPTDRVDPELIDYGHYVAQTFQSIVDQASGIEQKLAQAEADSGVESYNIGLLPTANSVNYGGYRMREYVPYGYAQINPAAAQQRLQQTEEEAYQAIQSARDMLTKLAADHETVRKNLAQRYGLKF